MASFSTTDTLKRLRLLPPPFNEMAPSTVSIGAFAIMSLLAGDRRDEVWTDFTAKYDGMTLWVTIPFVFYMTISWGWSLIVGMMEVFCPSFIRQFKIQPEEDPATWSQIAEMLPTIFLNQFVGCFGSLYAMYKLGENMRGESFTVDQTNEIPSISRFALLWALQLVTTDIWFYVSHRFLHIQFVYQNIHAQHHIYKAPTCLETAYMHPIESIITRYAVLIVIPHVVTRASLLEFYLWVCAVTFYQYQDHSGYWFPFLPSGMMHNYHHQRFLCCYGVVGFVDDLMGTTGGFHDYVAKKQSECDLKKA